MATAWVRSLARQIMFLSEPEREELAREILPMLLTTRVGLAQIDASLRDLSDEEYALVERARQRASDLSEDKVRRHHRRGAPDGPRSGPSVTPRSSLRGASQRGKQTLRQRTETRREI